MFLPICQPACHHFKWRECKCGDELSPVLNFSCDPCALSVRWPFFPSKRLPPGHKCIRKPCPTCSSPSLVASNPSLSNKSSCQAPCRSSVCQGSGTSVYCCSCLCVKFTACVKCLTIQHSIFYPQDKRYTRINWDFSTKTKVFHYDLSMLMPCKAGG